MSILFDIILISVALICIIGGARRGFVRSIMSIVTFVASVAAGYYFSPALSEFLYDGVIGRVASSVEGALFELMGSGSGAIGLDVLFADRPDAVADVALRYNNIPEAVIGFYENLTGGAAEALSSVTEFIAEPVAKTVSDTVAFLLIFFAAIIVLRILTAIIDAVCKLPILNGLNRTLGLVFGVISAFLYVNVLAIVCETAMPALISLFPEFFNEGIISQTMIMKWILENNIFAAFR